MNWKLFWDRKSTAMPAPDLFREMRLGTDAQILLDSASYQRAMQLMRVKIHEQWAESPLIDREGQHELRLMLKVLDGLEQHIKDEADTGKMAKQQHDQQHKNEQRKKAA